MRVARHPGRRRRVIVAAVALATGGAGVVVAADVAHADDAPLGIDVSNHQGSVDWGAVAASGQRFAIVKATEGTDFSSSTFDAQYHGAKDAGLYAGAYHFALPDRGSGSQQADWFLAHAQFGDDGRTLPPALDMEYNPYNKQVPCYGLSQPQMVNWVADFVNRIAQVTGRDAIIYTNNDWWGRCTGGSAAFANLPVWIADPNSRTSPLLPGGWSTWTFWQYGQGSVPGVTNAVDVNRFNGSVADLDRLAHGNGGAVHLETAFQANTSDLWVVGYDGGGDRQLGMAAGTSPSIASLRTGGYEVAFQANTGDLWKTGAAGTGDTGLRMAPGTSPSIAGLPGGGYEIAFQADNGDLYFSGGAGSGDTGLGMAAGTSPSIAVTPDGQFIVAFQANTGHAWTAGPKGTGDTGFGMAPGTSPSVAVLGNGHIDLAFQANTGDLYTVDNADGERNWALGMRDHTSPSITALPGGGFEVAFQSNVGELWTVGDAGNHNWKLSMREHTSPSIVGLPAGGFKAAFQAGNGDLWIAPSTGNAADQGLGLREGTSPSITA